MVEAAASHLHLHHSEGGWQPVLEEQPPVAIVDDELPVRLVWTGEGELRTSGSSPGFFEADTLRRRADGGQLYFWNPFSDAADELASRYHGRVSYGRTTLHLVGGGQRYRITLDIRPSGLSKQQIEQMRATVARVSEQLLRSLGPGRTWDLVGLSTGRPDDQAGVQASIVRNVRPLLPSLARIQARPYLEIGVPRPQRAGLDPRGLQAEANLDIYENRFVRTAVVHWSMLLQRCAQAARETAQRERDRLARLQAPELRRPPGGELGAIEGRLEQYEERAKEADALRIKLHRVLPGFDRLPLLRAHPHMTPRILRSPAYRRVFQAWWSIRKESIFVEATQLATRANIPAPFLYEHWVMFTLAALLMDRGWTPDSEGWLHRLDFDRYELAVRRGEAWVFRKDGEELSLVYEARMLALRKAKPRGRKAISSRDYLIREQAKQAQVEPGYYTVGQGLTPDLIAHWNDGQGKHTLVIGDARFTRVREDDGLGWDTPGADRRRGALESKAKTVRGYSDSSWMVLPGGRVVKANRYLGTVFFPGPSESADWLSSDRFLDVEPFPLAPTEHGAEPEGAGELMDDWIENMRGAEGIDELDPR